jgi:hypothetical protein
VELAGRPGAFDLNETATDGHPAALEEESHRMAEIARALHARDVRIAQTVEEALRLATARRAAFSRWHASLPRQSSKMPPCRGVNWRG